MAQIKAVWKDKRVRYGVGIVAGATVGYLYSFFIGCPQGGCPITSNPLLMTLIGGFMGYSLISNR